MRPKVTMHMQISLDGCIKGFDREDIYYMAADKIDHDTVLFGSQTVYSAFSDVPEETEADFQKPEINKADLRPIAVIPDSRGILRNLHGLRTLGYLKDVVILVSEATPSDYLYYLRERNYDYIVGGDDHVDYTKAFSILFDKYGCKTIRTDCGGVLAGVLLESGLVDEINLVVSPCLVGKGEKSAFEHLMLSKKMNLALIRSEIIEKDYLSLFYHVIQEC